MTRGLILTFALCASACSSSSNASSPATDGGSDADAGSNLAAPAGVVNTLVTHPQAGCTVTTEDAADSTVHGHVPVCSSLVYPHNPPMTGNHYPIWADFKRYDQPVPWGFLVHDLEHGGVVLSYNTGDAGAPDQLSQVVDALPDDPACTGGGRVRAVIVPDPDLDVPIAASAWGSHYKATCFDAASLRAFIDAHYAKAPEDECAPGQDLSAGGWCP